MENKQKISMAQPESKEATRPLPEKIAEMYNKLPPQKQERVAKFIQTLLRHEEALEAMKHDHQIHIASLVQDETTKK